MAEGVSDGIEFPDSWGAETRVTGQENPLGPDYRVGHRSYGSEGNWLAPPALLRPAHGPRDTVSVEQIETRPLKSGSWGRDICTLPKDHWRAPRSRQLELTKDHWATGAALPSWAEGKPDSFLYTATSPPDLTETPPARERAGGLKLCVIWSGTVQQNILQWGRHSKYPVW